ncbi:DNA polymerase eta [Hyposmocoma kahamanoa]|uniref:DNA polymerase eta n=1 Tax=Hyposmocoma kahamanoa TaxID=1477025 RepID=UPI000E6DA467|nr:DNA polymerase eta [Hyposmocoma kahamanoa]
MEQENRVVVLIDMDCFYCQVEEKLDPELKGKPIAVVQYNPWKGGGIIAVNYEARAMGVKRGMRGDEAKEKCPDIELPSVPCNRGKADITKYRDAGKEVARVLQKFTPLLERASIDEAYLDITVPVDERLKTLNVNSITTDLLPNTFALGYHSIDEFVTDVQCGGGDSIDFDYNHARRLLVGAVLVSEVRAAVFEETGYRCSAGIAHNKILAKLVCGMNKPNKQTVLPKHSIDILYNTLSIRKVKHLGGKFGDTVCDVLKIKTMGELQKFSEKELQARFDEKNGSWLYNIARGIDLEPVQARFNPKSIGCCKQFRGKSALIDLESLKKWLKDLGDEIEDRLEKDAVENNRTPKQMVVSFSTQLPDGRDMSSSRSYNFVAANDLCGDFFSSKALELVLDSSEGVQHVEGESNRKLKAPIKFLGISVGKFEDNNEIKKIRKINDYFGAGSSNANNDKESVKHNDVKESLIENKQMNNEDENKQKKNKDESKQKTSEGKYYIMQKFLVAADKSKDHASFKIKEEKTSPQANTATVKPICESTLEKQESFFAKFLNKTKEAPNSDVIRPTTPVCNVVNRGEDSNDTNYSGSTINDEINKSIALFDDDPKYVEQVGNMRDQLLNKTNTGINEEDVIEPLLQTDIKIAPESKCDNIEEEPGTSRRTNTSTQVLNTFECSECRKIIQMDMIDTHSDYHLALKLREEERQRVRNETKSKTAPKVVKETNTNSMKKKTVIEDNSSKNDPGTSIANFFLKFDDTMPVETCSECGKKVPLDNFAEHLDFHEAQKLSRELNKRDTPSYVVGNSAKRKKKSISPMKKPKLHSISTKSIDSFFR